MIIIFQNYTPIATIKQFDWKLAVELLNELKEKDKDHEYDVIVNSDDIEDY